ncbi:MAG: ABC transporter permease [Clostridiales bacterium]|nr:ABC transporter permease [Candidatus Cacconaster stercorequi]
MSVLNEVIRAHLHYRKQLFKLAKSDLVKTYKGAALGWAWAFIQPMITIFTYYFAIAVGLRSGKPVNGCPYFLYLISGMIPWFYMSGTFTGGAGSIRHYRYLVTKIRYPVCTIPTIVSTSKLMINGVLTVVMLSIFVACGYRPTIYWLQIPIYFLMMYLFFTAWALFAGMLSVMSKDFLHLVQSVKMMLFWMSGILYNVDKVNNHTIRTILKFNPITIVATGYRHSLINKVWIWEDLVTLRNYVIVYVVMVALALWVYKRLIKDIPDVL